MDILDTNTASSSLAVEGSHPGTMLYHPSYNLFDGDQFMDEEYLGDLAQGATARVMADLSISEHHRGVSSTVAGCLNYDAHSVCVEQLLCFLGYDETAESSLSCISYASTPSEPSHSEDVDPRLISENSTVPSSPNYRNSEDYFDPCSALPSQNVPDSDVKDEQEPFLSPCLFNRCEATSGPAVDGDENAADTDEGEDEIEESSTESSQKGTEEDVEQDVEEDVEEDSEEDLPYLGPGPVPNAPYAQACPGLRGKDEDEIQEDLRKCMAQAAPHVSDTFEQCSQKMRKVGQKFKCTECGEKKQRRDRLWMHIHYKHLDRKLWICPRCERGYTGRNELYNHLLSKRVVCLCGKSLTKNNSYTHARICKACTAIGGRPKVENGRIVMVQVTAPQAAPSHITHDSVGEDEPRAPPQRIGRNMAKKRKERDFNEENEDDPCRRKSAKSRST